MHMSDDSIRIDEIQLFDTYGYNRLPVLRSLGREQIYEGERLLA